MGANDRQVAGDHYQVERGKEQHWDRVWRLGLDYFQGQITKYVERWKLKNGIEDLKKARHFLDKYIELNSPEETGSIDLTSAESAAASLEKSGRRVVHIGAGTLELTGVISTEEEIANGVYESARTDTYRWGEVMPTGWTQFVFEGATQEGFFFTCRSCHGKFYTPPDRNPHSYHECRDLADSTTATHDAAEAGSAYTNQG